MRSTIISLIAIHNNIHSMCWLLGREPVCASKMCPFSWQLAQKVVDNKNYGRVLTKLVEYTFIAYDKLTPLPYFLYIMTFSIYLY